MKIQNNLLFPDNLPISHVDFWGSSKNFAESIKEARARDSFPINKNDDPII